MKGAFSQLTQKLKTENEKLHDADRLLLAVSLILIVLGVVMVFSASQYKALFDNQDSYFYLKKQLRNVLFGAVAMMITYLASPRLMFRYSKLLYIIVIGMMVSMKVLGLAVSGGGAARWMEAFGTTFQPSEFTKLILPMMVAGFCTVRMRDIQQLKKGFFPALMLVVIVVGMIYLQSDLSSAIVVAVSGFMVIFCAGAKIWHLVGTGAAGIGGIVAAIELTGYRSGRIDSWLDPWNTANIYKDYGSSWQEVQSLIAIGNGGLVGVGVGNSGSKWYYLPAQHTDCIFALFCEEWGFIGAVLMILLFAILFWRGILIAIKAPDIFSSLLCIGIISSLVTQTLINLCVCTGLCPITGVTLPFISYGGSSLLVTMAMVGVLLNISRRTVN